MKDVGEIYSRLTALLELNYQYCNGKPNTIYLTKDEYDLIVADCKKWTDKEPEKFFMGIPVEVKEHNERGMIREL